MASPALAANGGYAGLIAPAQEEDKPAAAPKAAAPSYGSSVLAPDPNAPAPPPVAIATPSRVLAPPASPAAVAQAKRLGKAPQKNNPKLQSFAQVQPARLGNLSAAELAAQRNIERVMRLLGDKSRPVAERQAQAKKSYANLSRLAAGLSRRESIPDRIYQSQGVSPAAMAEKRRANRAALAKLNEALTKLYPYR